MDTADFPIPLAARTALTIDDAPTFRHAVTEFGRTEWPNRLKSLIEYVERIGAPETNIYRCNTLSMMTPYAGSGLEGAHYRLMGANIHRYSCAAQAVQEYWQPIASTTVPIDTLFNAIFQRPKRPQFLLRSPYVPRGEDLIIRYFTDTTRLVHDFSDEPFPILIFDPDFSRTHADAGLFEAAPALPPLREAARDSKSRAIARKLADFLNVTLKDLGGMTNIGRTTFSSWQTKNPRAATLFDLYRLDSLIGALRSTLGDERAKTWLHAGSPSPFSLLAVNDLSAVETLASALIFEPFVQSPSLSVSGYDMTDLPIAKPYGGSIRAAKRAIRGRLTLDT
jgi:hypothetical protein